MANHKTYVDRARIERIIDNLVALLDASEPDPDLEPSLGYGPYGVDLEGDDADDEPWLGWAAMYDGGPGATGNLDDREQDTDYEPNTDLEANSAPDLNKRPLALGEVR
jgi:hypothetical protein